MLAPQAFVRAIVSRLLPPFLPDSSQLDVALTCDSYQALFTQPKIRKSHALADEGSYFIINNAQTGITPPLGTSFSATAPALLIYNNDPVRRLYIDYINLMNIVAVTCTAGTAGQLDLNAAFVVDNGNRYSSGGTNLPVAISPNMAIGAAASNITSYFGALTAVAATGAARTVLGQRMIRPLPVAAAMTVVGDNFLFNFGGVEAQAAGSITIANANVIPVPMPPVIIGQNQSALLYLWWASLTPAGGSSGFLPEIGFWLR